MFDLDFLNSLIGFFNEQPFLSVFLLYALIYYKDLKPLKVLLSNHIIDTNKKIDRLETEFKAGYKELETNMREGYKELETKMKAGYKELETNMKEGYKELETKMKELNGKMDMLTNTLTTMLLSNRVEINPKSNPNPDPKSNPKK